MDRTERGYEWMGGNPEVIQKTGFGEATTSGLPTVHPEGRIRS